MGKEIEREHHFQSEQLIHNMRGMEQTIDLEQKRCVSKRKKKNTINLAKIE
jgi:hypothetical protein